MRIQSKSAQIKTKLKKAFSTEDLVITPIKTKSVNGFIAFIDSLADKRALGELVLKPVLDFTGKAEKNALFNAFLSPEKKSVTEMDDAVSAILSGDAVLFIDDLNCAFSFGLKQFDKRAITEPPTSEVIKGPREGFVESVVTNMSLMRRRIKSPHLRFDQIIVGKYSKTPVYLCYIDGIVNPNIVNKLKNKIGEINIDALLDSSYISKFLGEHKTSLFKQVGNTEKPDVLAAKILEGRVGILVDGSPITITVPYILVEDFQSPADYYNSAYASTISRILRLASVFISLFLPAFFVAAQLFHLQLIPLAFLLTIVNSIKGLPLSPSYEMFFTLVIFEILNEASVRMPKSVGMVVSIVGGLVLGETAVNAGIISAPALMIIALSGVCLYTVPELEQSFSILRLILLVVAGIIGAYGLILASAFIIIYMVSFENYSTPLVAPFAPLVPKDLKDTFYKGFLKDMKYRPKSISNVNPVRLKNKGKKDVST